MKYQKNSQELIKAVRWEEGTKVKIWKLRFVPFPFRGTDKEHDYVVAY